MSWASNVCARFHNDSVGGIARNWRSLPSAGQTHLIGMPPPASLAPSAHCSACLPSNPILASLRMGEADRQRDSESAPDGGEATSSVLAGAVPTRFDRMPEALAASALGCNEAFDRISSGLVLGYAGVHCGSLGRTPTHAPSLCSYPYKSCSKNWRSSAARSRRFLIPTLQLAFFSRFSVMCRMTAKFSAA